MECRTLGKLDHADMNVSALGLGCWAFSGDGTWGEQDERASIATVHEALDMGVNVFDTAEAYGKGRSEVLLGKAPKVQLPQFDGSSGILVQALVCQ